MDNFVQKPAEETRTRPRKFNHQYFSDANLTLLFVQMLVLLALPAFVTTKPAAPCTTPMMTNRHALRPQHLLLA